MTDGEEDILYNIEEFIDPRWFRKGPNRMIKTQIQSALTRVFTLR